MKPFMFNKESHPYLFGAVSIALNMTGHSILSKDMSGDPFSEEQIERCEDFLRLADHTVTISDEIQKLFNKENSIFPSVDCALEKENGADPASDVTFLMFSASQGDM